MCWLCIDYDQSLVNDGIYQQQHGAPLLLVGSRSVSDECLLLLIVGDGWLSLTRGVPVSFVLNHCNCLDGIPNYSYNVNHYNLVITIQFLVTNG